MKKWENTKSDFCEMVRGDLLSGTFSKAYPELPGVAGIEAGYDLGRTKCDLVVSHIDKSISIFECMQADLDYGDYLTGIGHLVHARAQFVGYQHDVRVFLAVMSETDADLGFACQAAGIIYAPCGRVEEHNSVGCRLQ